MSRKKPSFEEALSRLEELVRKLESGELSLEQSISCFEEGVRLARDCGRQLEKAEQKVRLLLEEDGGNPPVSGDSGDSGDSGEGDTPAAAPGLFDADSPPNEANET